MVEDAAEIILGSRWFAGAKQGLSAKIGRVRATIEIVAKLVGASRLYRSERSWLYRLRH